MAMAEKDVADCITVFGQDLTERFAVEQADDEVSVRNETVVACRTVVLQHVPELAAIVMTVDADVRPHAWFQIGDAVPGRTLETIHHNEGNYSH